ncbi:MAG TPA: hypothetical protein VJ907_10170 [Halanaerobiales bacterium]|nr:hypothetical protein [Halanaerobiales bacterium]
MENIKLIEHRKIRICCDNEKQSIELGRDSIDHGFLKTLPGPSLPVFLYLITHLDNNNLIKTNPAIMAGFLTLDREQIKEGLKILNNNNYIDLQEKKEGNYTYKIELNLNKIVGSCYFDNSKKQKKKLKKYRNKVIKETDLVDEDYKKALISFLPEEVENSLIEEEIEHWLKDFDKTMIKELIRRVDKWVKNNNKSSKEGFYYLHGIIDDWYNKEIFEYKRLKYFDRMYRETNELAKCYGLKNWYNVSEAQMEIFYDWLNDKNGINISLAKFAIKEAFKRKSDGQPSLKYIEDNFIIPFKENNIKNIREAKSVLNNNSKQKPLKKEERETTSDSNWETFEWDIEDLN